jgi:hypothetical protein
MNGKILLALLFVAGLAFAIQPVENWTQVSTGKYTPVAAAAVITEGGNVTNLDLRSNVSTEKWAGFYGNVSGGIVLAQASGGSMFYTWAWTPAYGGEVCALADNSFDWANVASVTASAIDAAWGFLGTETDDAAATFDENCNINIAGTAVANTNATTTGSGADTFQTCALSDTAVPAKGDLAFCVKIQNAGTLFNTATGDYELLTAANATAGEFENYNFWLELN